MLFLLVQLDIVIQAHQHAVHPGAHVTRLAGVLEDFLVFTLFPAHRRRKQLDLRPRFPCHDRIDDLVHRLLAYHPATGWAMRHTDTGV